MASELQAQKFVHELEHGKGRWWVWFLVILAVGFLYAWRRGALEWD